MDLQLDTRLSGDAAIVSVGGEIDHFTAPQLRSALEAAAEHDLATLVVDLSATDFLDSSGLGALMATHKRQAGAGRALMVVCPAPHLRKLFAISHLDEVLDVHDSLEGALAAG